MNMYWLYELPNWLFGVLTIAVTAAVGLSGLHTTRRWVRRVHGDRHSHNEVVGYYLSAVCVFYGITLGLLAVALVLRFIGFCAEKRADLPGNYFVPFCVTVRILEDDDEHENEDDDFSTSEFRLN